MSSCIRWIVCCLAFCWLLSGEAFGQHYVGVRAGYGGGLIRFQSRPARETGLWLGAPSAGVSWKYYSPEPVVGGIQADLQYVTKGYKEFHRRIVGEETVTDSMFTRTASFIELPLMWQIHAYAFNRKVRIYFNLGVYASYMFGSDSEMTRYTRATGSQGETIITSTTENIPYEIRSTRDNQFGYGLVGGPGIGFLFNRWEAFVEARYGFGYSDLLTNQTKYPPNTGIFRSPLDMVNISFGFYYRLGKGGILAPPAGTNRSTESWDSIPAGRPPTQGSGSGNSGSPGTSPNQPSGSGTMRQGPR